MVSFRFDFTVNEAVVSPAGMVTRLGYSSSPSWSLPILTVNELSVAVLRFTYNVISPPSFKTEEEEVTSSVGPSLSYTVSGTVTVPPEVPLPALQLQDAIQTAAVM